jgi:biotin operon repressor
VIIDTLARFGSWKQGNYTSDYQETAKLKALADRLHIAMILVHHERKTGAIDILDRVSGSTGLTGAVDNIFIFERQRFQADATLLIIGRDQPDTKLALKFDNHTWLWEIQEPREVDHLTPERRDIVDFFKAASTPLRLQDIALALGKKETNVSNLLKKLTDQGIVRRVRHGIYQLESRPDQDQRGSYCQSVPSLMQVATPWESQPASPMLGSEAAGEDIAPSPSNPLGQPQENSRQTPSLGWQVPGLDQEYREDQQEM